MNDLVELFERRLYAIEAAICAVSLVVMLMSVALGVCIRVFDWPLPNVAEWGLAAMSPLTFVGCAMCVRARAHIAVDIISHVTVRYVQPAALAISALMVLLFAAIYSWLSLQLFSEALGSGEHWLDMNTPLHVPIFFYLVGMVCMLAHALCDGLRLISGRGLPGSMTASDA